MKEKSYKALKIASVIALIIILIAASCVIAFYVKFSKLQNEEDVTEPEYFVEVQEDSSHQLQALRGKEDLSSVLKEWATNSAETDLMQSDDVINFLLIGLDEGGMRSDVIMMLSLNKVNKTLYLTSFFRDSYTYINSPYGDRFAKINACYSNGGALKLIETLQNNYKIKIDHYASVDFQSFIRIVDIMGGVKLPIKEYEAAEMGKGTPYGPEVLVNGEQALTYCRIRHCDADADVSRTRRQRQFIMALINRSKEVKISQLNEILDTLLRYVKTDCSVTELVSYGTQAIANKWYSYNLKNMSIPKEQHRLDYRGYSWVWIVDYPAAAKDLQNEIYGEDNIILRPDRINAITLMQKDGNKGEAQP